MSYHDSSYTEAYVIDNMPRTARASTIIAIINHMIDCGEQIRNWVWGTSPDGAPVLVLEASMLGNLKRQNSPIPGTGGRICTIKKITSLQKYKLSVKGIGNKPNGELGQPGFTFTADPNDDAAEDVEAAKKFLKQREKKGKQGDRREAKQKKITDFNIPSEEDDDHTDLNVPKSPGHNVPMADQERTFRNRENKEAHEKWSKSRGGSLANSPSSAPTDPPPSQEETTTDMNTESKEGTGDTGPSSPTPSPQDPEQSSSPPGESQHVVSPSPAGSVDGMEIDDQDEETADLAPGISSPINGGSNSEIDTSSKELEIEQKNSVNASKDKEEDGHDSRERSPERETSMEEKGGRSRARSRDYGDKTEQDITIPGPGLEGLTQA